MVVLAVMAAGVHTMSIAAPAMAEQERLALDAEAAAERAVTPNVAASDGLPVPALLGGIVLAFAVGLSAGHVQRRRRVARRSAEALTRPAPTPTPSVPARPAPPPPSPAAKPAPAPVEIAAPPPPPPPPPPVRSRGQRILRLRPTPAPPPPEPDELVAEPPEPAAAAAPPEAAPPEPAAEVAPPEPRIEETVPEPVVVEPPAPEPVAEPEPEPEPVAEPEPEPEPVAEPPAPEPEPEPVAVEPPAPEPVPEPTEPLSVAPEVPLRDEMPPVHDAPATPLAETPEALRRRKPEPEVVVVPARRFARAEPWPEDAESLWTCEIAWKAGYLKSTFRAMAGPPGAARRKSFGESPSLRWTLMTDPDPPTSEMVASVKVLVHALVDAGWERTGAGAAWYAQRFVWRGSDEPQPVDVPDAIESAEPPSR